MHLDIMNPADGTRLHRLEMCTSVHIAERFAAAQRAQVAWAQIPLSERKAPIAKFMQRLIEERDVLALDLTREMGKPIAQARSEITATADRIKYFLDHIDSVLADRDVTPEGARVQEVVRYEPLGVIANISAWNYPYFVGSNVFVPALLAGNAVLYKPSEYATLSGLHITRLLHECGISNALFSCVVGHSHQGEALLSMPVDGVFFTGSYKTGCSIAERMSQRLVPVQLELGGKDAVYVCEDADLDHAVASIAEGAFYNTGQSCCSVERIFVHQNIAQPFTERFVKEVAGFLVGDGAASSCFIGPLTLPSHPIFLQKQVEASVKAGAKLLLGGKAIARKGNFFEPTVLSDVPLHCSLMQEESFGPIAPIHTLSSDEEAISAINDNVYGLTCAVYSRSPERADAILRRIHTGTVYWNCSDRVSPRLPWSGRKHSGIGSTLGIEGIKAFVRPKSWHMARP